MSEAGNVIELKVLTTLIISVIVLSLGKFLTERVHFLKKYNIPVAVSGGIICSLVIAGIFKITGSQITFDLSMRDVLLVMFFSTIGLSAKMNLLLNGGKTLFVMLILAIIFLFVQNTIGVLVALGFGGHPGYGLIAGSISFAGGHGTAISWGTLAQNAGLDNALELGLICATFGLILGGVLGGPLAQRLITKNNLHGDKTLEACTPSAENKSKGVPVTADGMIGAMFLLALCIGGGKIIYGWLDAAGIVIPKFLPAMFVGIVLTNLADAVKIRFNQNAVSLWSDVSLQIFLAMSLMSMKLWSLGGAVAPLAVVLICQSIVMLLFAYLVVFRITGRNYDASVMSAGFVGLGLGATPVGIANMQAIVNKYGASPKAFFVIPLIGAFFIDIANALIIKLFTLLPVFERTPVA